MNVQTLECAYRETGVGKILSNLFPRPFMFRGQYFASMEGFLQSLKTKDEQSVIELAGLSGVNAWKSGQKYNDWKHDQILFFQEKPVERLSDDYITLVRCAYDAQVKVSPDLRNALLESFPRVLTHKGKNDPCDTVLTVCEYIGNLNRMRDILIKNQS